MKKIMILGALLCAAINMNANVITDNVELDTISLSDSWKSNWFVGAQAGASIYVGKPLGCADAFDRISPNIHVYAGKWFTPAVGTRLSYQGYEVKGCHLGDMSIQSYHADLMYNVMSYRHNKARDQRFDLIPYAGCGLIHNSDLHNSDFSLNYGIQAKYHLNDRLHLTAEVSGLTTFQQFDGHGTSDRLGDHKFDVSLGLSVNLGKVGFKKVKAQPIAYKTIDQSYHYKPSKREAADSTKTLCKRTISVSASYDKKHPVNDYSGLNSLRARLAEAGSKSTDNNANTPAETKNESAKATLVNGADTLGLTIPYICYFKINTHDLTNSNQLDYLSEIVKLAQERGMAIRVIGAADSATGTAAINQRLSEERADYIASQLQALGMNADHIQQQALGGIEEFTPVANNRYCKIQLVPLSSTSI